MISVDYAYRANLRPASWRRASLTFAGWFWSLYSLACVLVLLTAYSWCAVAEFYK